MTDRQRKIEALRRLAAAPGTPAEGEVARRMLQKLEATEQARRASSGRPTDQLDEIDDLLSRAIREDDFERGRGFTEAELEKEFGAMFQSAGYRDMVAELNRKMAWMASQDFMGTLNRAAGGATRKSGKGS